MNQQPPQPRQANQRQYDPEEQEIDPFTDKPVGVTGSAPSDIVQFLEDALELGPIDTVTIWVDRLDSKEKVRTLPVRSINPIDLSARISAIIKSHAAGRGRRTTFLIEAHAGSESRGMVPVVREIQPNTQGAGLAEPPTEAGLVAQAMRHTEASARTAHVTVDAFAGHITRELREQRVRIKQLEAERDAVALRMRDLTVQSIDQEFMRAKNQQSLAIRELATQAVLAQLPAIVQRFTSVEVIERVKQFAMGLTPEQYGQIGAALNPGQVEQFSALLSALQPKQLLPEQPTGQPQQAAE